MCGSLQQNCPHVGQCVCGRCDLSTDTPQSYTGQKGLSSEGNCSVRWELQHPGSVQAVKDKLCPVPELNQCPEIHIMYINSHHQSLQDCVESSGRFKGRYWHPSFSIMEELNPETLGGLLHCCFVTKKGSRPLESLC